MMIPHAPPRLQAFAAALPYAGFVPQVTLLVEEGGADLSVKDRWGATPLDEAQRVGAADVAVYLSSSKAEQAAAAARTALAARQGRSNRFGAQL
jgi:ankyrin repeat protein